MRLRRENNGIIRVRPSRLYGLQDGRLRGTAVKAIIMAFISLGFAVVVIVWATPVIALADRLSPWGLISCVFLELIWCFFTYVTWAEIPARLVVTTPDQVRSFCDDRPFVLILWSFREYQDLLGTAMVVAGVHMRLRNAPQGLDSYIAREALLCGLRSIRLWRKDVGGFVSSESIHLICPDVIWREVVHVALFAATAIVLVPGRGEGLAWEREVVAASPELKAKTLTLSTTLKMPEIKAALITHFERLTDKTRVAPVVRAIP